MKVYWLLSLALLGCQTGAGSTESDAVPIDGGSTDAAPDVDAAEDASRPGDLGLQDAGFDAAVSDAASPDAAQPDAGASDATLPDATLPDAGEPDAAQADAAEPDAGEPDMAPPPCSDMDRDGICDDEDRTCNADRSPLRCRERAPACRRGEVAEVRDGCYTGRCLTWRECGADPCADADGDGVCDEADNTCNVDGPLDCVERPPACGRGTQPEVRRGCYTGRCLSLAECANPGPEPCDPMTRCNAGSYCEYAEACGGEGACTPIPAACGGRGDSVCGCNSVTYDTECHAAQAGVTVAAAGPCIEPQRACTPRVLCLRGEYCALEACGLRGVCESQPGRCPPERNPVCGCDGDTYGNECEAAQAGSSVAYVGECNAPEEQCPDGHFDLDGDPAGVCEYACVRRGDFDVPDETFQDANCDGVDGNAEESVFVANAPLGRPDGAGTREDPVDTISRAILIADVIGRQHVLVAEGVYPEVVELVEGIDIHGGYRPFGLQWPRRRAQDAPLPTTIRAAVTTIWARDFAALTVLGNLAIQAQTPAEGFATVAAVRVEGASVLLRNVLIEAGDGTDGARGIDGTDGIAGVAGIAGADGIENSNRRPDAAPGGDSACGGRGGVGGVGGFQPAHGEIGGAGAPGARDNCAECVLACVPVLAAGGVGGAGQESVDNGGPLCGESQPGENGAVGVEGGDGCAGVGGVGGMSHPEFGWVGATGTRGGRGADGGGGGGGGGGGDDACGLERSDRAGSAGGGGGGGCGATGGRGGTGGGGSFGVLSVNGIVVAIDSRIQSGDGGRGGRGGSGGRGGAGAQGGTGGAPSDDSGGGGDGGRGGDGGSGGCAGGGGGGFAFAVYHIGRDGGFEGLNSVLSHGSGGVAGGGCQGDAQPGENGDFGTTLAL